MDIQPIVDVLILAGVVKIAYDVNRIAGAVGGGNESSGDPKHLKVKSTDNPKKKDE